MFADDTNLTASGDTITNIEVKLRKDLENMIAGSRQRINEIENHPDIRLGNDNIKRVKETKTLGIIIDDQLKWNTQIDNVVAKVSRAIGLIQCMKMFVPQATLISVYNATVQPHLILTTVALSGI